MNSIKGENSMATKVNTYRTTAKAVGALYILGFVVGFRDRCLAHQVSLTRFLPGA